MFYDVIVIGAGLAGLMAANVAQSRGARVLILARGMGSLPLTSGCIDVLGYFPNTPKSPISSPRNVLAQIKEIHPHHPYIKLGPERIALAINHFRDLCAKAGLAYAGDFDRNFLIPTSLGTLHPTCLVPETMKNGDLSKPGSVFLLGMEGIKDFSPFWAAENLNLLNSMGKIAPSFRAGWIEKVDLNGKAYNSLSLAHALDDPTFRERFAKKVQSLPRKGERIGFPALLGFRFPTETSKDLQEKLDAEIFEIPLPPPSVPGLRLYNALNSHFRNKGGRLIMGFSALQPLNSSGKLEAFALGSSKGSPLFRASAFVLGTGKFVGGGLDSDRNGIFETLLSLPVKHPSKRQAWFAPELLTPEGQPFNSIGIEVDENLRPVDSTGRVIYKNLFAAGGILAHADSMAEKSGGGVALATGYRAGEFAADLAKKDHS